MDANKILCDLIQLRTDDNTKENTAFVDYVCNLLAEQDILFKRITNPTGVGENILAGINVQAFENIQNGLILSGHMDTVGANADDWGFNPFAGYMKNGRIYGRGTVDMKYFIAVILSLLPEIKKVNMPIFFVFTSDEETDTLGIQTVLSFLDNHNVKPKFALVGEPTHFELCIGNRGYFGYTTIVKGVSVHSSAPELGVNAAYISAKIISKIEELNKKYASLGASLNVGVITGGVGRNTVPSEAAIDWEIRYKQEDTKSQILNEIEIFHQKLLRDYHNAQIFLKTTEPLPAFEEKTDNKLALIAGQILGTKTFSLPYATEAGFFQRIGIDTLICGAGDETLAHSASEYIEENDLNKYRVFLMDFLRAVAHLD